jgi:hypothetical protein
MRVLAMIVVTVAILCGLPGYPVWVGLAIGLMGVELTAALKR